ncbi:MAG: hypothetical protein ACMUIG_10755, partial [Thermoplasmatota archaeon]
VEHVFGFCTPDQRKLFFRQLPDFEKMMVDEGITLVKPIYNDGNKSKVEGILGKGHSYSVIKVMMGLYILLAVGTPIILFTVWILLLKEPFVLILFLFVTLFIEFVIIIMMKVFHRNYYYEYFRSDFIVHDDRIQLSIPNIQLKKEDIRAVILDENDFDKHRKKIRSSFSQKFFRIANKITVTGFKDFKRYFIEHNAVLIIHDDPRDRLGMQLIDDRYHNDLDGIKDALRRFLGFSTEMPKKTKKRSVKSKGIVTIRPEFDRSSSNKLLLKIGAAFFLTLGSGISLMIAGFNFSSLEKMWILGVFLIFAAIFEGALIMGLFMQKLVNLGDNTYTMDGTYIRAQIASNLGYQIPLKHISWIRKLPDGFNSNLRQTIRYDRSAGHIPKHCFKNSFMIQTSKGIWPITTLGGARPYTTFIIGDDDGRTGYRYIKNYISLKNVESKQSDEKTDAPDIDNEKMKNIRNEEGKKTGSRPIRIRFRDRRNSRNNLGLVIVVGFAYILALSCYLFFIGAIFYAGLTGNPRAFIILPFLFILNVLFLPLRMLILFTFFHYIPFKRFGKTPIVISKKWIILPWYDGLGKVRKVKLKARSTVVKDFSYHHMTPGDLKKIGKVGLRIIFFLFFPLNRVIFGKVQHPLGSTLAFFNGNDIYFYPTEILEEDFQRKLDGIVEYGDDIYDE